MLKKFRRSLSKALIFTTLFGGASSLNSKAFLGFNEEDSKYIPMNRVAITQIDRDLPFIIMGNNRMTQREYVILTYALSWIDKYKKFLECKDGMINNIKKFVEQKIENKEIPNHRCELWTFKPFIKHLEKYVPIETLKTVIGENYVGNFKNKEDDLSRKFLNKVNGTPDQQKRELEEFLFKTDLKKCPICCATINQWSRLIDTFYPSKIEDNNLFHWNYQKLEGELGYLPEALLRLNQSNTNEHLIRRTTNEDALKYLNTEQSIKILNEDELSKKNENLKLIQQLQQEAKEQEKQKELEKKLAKERKPFNISEEYPENEDKKENEEVKEKKPYFDLNPNDYIIPESSPYKMILGGKVTDVSKIKGRREYKGSKVTEFVRKTQEELQKILNDEEFEELKSQLYKHVENKVIKDIGNFIKTTRNASKDSIDASALKSIHFYNADELNLEKLNLKKPQYEVIYENDGKIRSSSIIAYQDFFKLENSGIFASYKLSSNSNKRLVVYIEGKFEITKRRRQQVETPKCTKVRYFVCDHYSAESPWYEIEDTNNIMNEK